MLLRRRFVSLVCFTLISDFTFALPMNPVIHEGNVAIRYENNLAEIDSGAFAELHWDDFSIGADETVRFLQPNASAVAINRVLSANPSSLFGKLESIGQIVLINPNGILVGRDAMINTGSLIASTFDLFGGTRSKNQIQFPSSVVNEGAIRTRSGDLILLGETVVNLGSIFSCKTVLIGAGSDLSLTLEEQPKIAFGSKSGLAEIGIENVGSIIAMGPDAKISLEAPFSTISHQGSLIAKNDIGLGGEIRILGGANHIHENSLIDVSGQFGGGTILIGGDYKGQNPSISNSKHTWVAPGSAIFANAADNGNGGKIIFWGNESTYFRGVAEAHGGMMSGDGGFIEISSKGMLDTEGKINLLAPKGKTGMLFLDPTIVTITAAANSGISAFPPPGYTFSAAMANISTMVATTLQTYLMTSDVTIDATMGPGPAGTGSITVSAPIAWATPSKLTLIAETTIDVLDTVSATNLAVANSTPIIELRAPTINIGATPLLAINTAVACETGRIVIEASNSLNVYSNTAAVPLSGILGGASGTDATVVIQNTGNINLDGTGGTSAVYIAGNEGLSIDCTGNINVTADGATARIATASAASTFEIFADGNITLQGGSATMTSSQAIITAFQGGILHIEIGGDYFITGGAATGAPVIVDGSAGITFAGTGSLEVSGQNYYLTSGYAVGGIRNNAAVIGVSSPGSGPVSVTATGSTGIVLESVGGNGGAGEIAMIGSTFGPPGTVSGNVTVTTTNLSVSGSTVAATSNGHAFVTANGDLTVNASGDITINGGGGVGAMFNIAALATFSMGNVLTITADNMFVNGGICPFGIALINSLNGPANIDINGGFFLQGGSGANAYACVGTGDPNPMAPVGTGSLTISGGNYSLIGGTGANANAFIGTGDPLGTAAGGSGNVSVTSTGATGITLTGGTSTKAAISANGLLLADITIQTTHLTLKGSTAGGSTNGNAFISGNGDITIGASGNITLIGGGGISDNAAEIFTSVAGKFVDITGANNVLLTGGSTPNSYAYIEAINGPLTANITGDYTLQGGIGASCYAAIGSGDPNHLVPIGTGNITLSGGNYSLTGGAGANGNAFIGTGDPQTMMVGGDGNVSITSTGATGITLTGGLSTKGTIQARELPLADISIQTTRLTLNGSTVAASVIGNGSVEAFGDITIDATGDITLTGGSTGNSNEAIIITFTAGKFVHITRADNVQLTGGSTMDSRASILAFGGPLTSTITGDYLIQGGSGDGASAGIAAAPAGGTGDMNISGRNFTLVGGSGTGSIAAMITGQPGGGGGDGSLFLTSTGFAGISLTGGSGAMSHAMIDTNGTLPTNAITITSTHPSGNLNLTSGSGAQARISTFGGPVNVWIGHDINLVSTPGNTATIAINGGASDLTVQAGHSASINSSIVNLGTGDIYFVVDAAFPAPPLFGTGGFHLGSGAFFQSAGGAIRIFTSQQSFNTIDGSFIDAFLVSHAFTAGTLFIDTNGEVWCTYYPSTFGGIPFTIFYKNCLQELAQQANLIAGELLADLHPYNEFPGWWKRFTMSTAGIDLEHAFSTPYFITQRVLGNIWLPKSYTSYLHDIFE